MEDNKYNKIYSKQSVSDLIIKLKNQRVTGNSLKKDWYEALISHLKERELSTSERESIDYILTQEFVNDIRSAQSAALVQEGADLIINPQLIRDAGISILGIFYTITASLIINIFGFILIFKFMHRDALVTTSIVLGTMNIILLLIILSKIHTTGVNFKNSITQKKPD